MADGSVRGSTLGRVPIAPALGTLPADDWRVFHQVHRAGPQFAGIDHVAVGPQGVFVVHAATWSGEVDVDTGVLRRDGRRQPKPVEEAVQAAHTVADLLPRLGHEVVHPVLCLTRSEPVFGWVGEVMVCSVGNLVKLVRSRPEVLEERSIHQSAELLGQAFYADRGTDARSRRAARRLPPHRRPPGLPRPRRRARSGAPSTGRTLLAFAVVVLLLCGIFLGGGAQRLGDLGASVWHPLGHPEGRIGEPITVEGRGRPALEITAGKPVPTRSLTRGQRAGPGRVLVAVPVTIHNEGKKTWSPQVSTSAALVDDSETVLQREVRFTRVTAGRVLSLGAKIEAGRTSRGFVVFEVPRGRSSLSEVQLTVGPGVPKTLHWKLPES